MSAEVYCPSEPRWGADTLTNVADSYFLAYLRFKPSTSSLLWDYGLYSFTDG